MKIYLTPQFTFDNEYIKYMFENDKITISYKNVVDVFDFTNMPDDVESKITTVLEEILTVNPILSAKRKKGILYVELLNLIPENATYEEKFPKWIDSNQYISKEGIRYG